MHVEDPWEDSEFSERARGPNSIIQNQVLGLPETADRMCAMVNDALILIRFMVHEQCHDFWMVV